jgi:hypothetical protein
VSLRACITVLSGYSKGVLTEATMHEYINWRVVTTIHSPRVCGCST